uniref:Uncharacterized protein n=1 Tax=Tetranychus urticae TaxID=32264 RepID=T1JS12_TETUR
MDAMDDKTCITSIEMDGKPGQEYFLKSEIINRDGDSLKVNLILTNILEAYTGTYETNLHGDQSLEAFVRGNKTDSTRTTKYIFILDTKKCLLTWKLVQYDEEGDEVLRMPIDNVLLKKASLEATQIVSKILKEMKASIAEKNAKIKQLSDNNKRLKQNCADTTNRLEKFAQLKQNEFKKLIDVSIGLINEKKKMIRDLLASGATFGKEKRVWNHEVKDDDVKPETKPKLTKAKRGRIKIEDDE